MKSPEEIKEALKRCHTLGTSCKGCAYYEYEECEDKHALEALAYIQQLEERIDLMMLQMRGDCGVCKNRDLFDGTCEPCQNHPFNYHPLWEYEGLPGEDTCYEKPV